MATSKAQETKDKKKVLRQYLSIARKVGYKSPTIAELEEHGLSRNRLRHHWGTRADLDVAAREATPKAFRDVAFTELEAADPTSKTIIITSPVLGAPAHKGFCNALREMADRKGADLVALPVADPASRSTPNGIGRLDKKLLDLGFQVVKGDLNLNENLQILGIEITAKQLIPISGLDRFGQRGKSIIVPSPKRFLRFVATNSATPHAIMTPGACTLANYDTDAHRSKRTAYLATQDHLLGAIIVEIKGKKKFDFRQLTWDEKRKDIVDLGETHKGEKYAPEAIVLGDWHSGDTAQENRDFAFSNPLGARCVFLHDSFNGKSINPHARHLEYLTTKLSLEDELNTWVDDLNKFSDVYDEVFIVHSNHDDWIARWIREGRHLKDRRNYRLGRELETAILDGLPPLESYYIDADGSDNVHFLRPDESVRVGEVELGIHGHIGASGSRSPSLRALESSVGNIVAGHAHTPGIYRNAWRAGTSTHLDLDYTQGPSSWLWSHVAVYLDGRRQMINIIP